jgi:proteasome lid subunit RPN8/RPN11
MDIASTTTVRQRLADLVRGAGGREVCALLYGVDRGVEDGAGLTLDRVVPVRNLCRGPGRFAFRASALEVAAHVTGNATPLALFPIALFHSHPPGHALTPSRADLVMFRRTPFRAQLIGALARPSSRSSSRSPVGAAFCCAAFDPHGQEIALSWH